jgi:hypothetical protein
MAPIFRRLFGSLELSDARFRNTFKWTPAVETAIGLRKMALGYRASIKGARHGPSAEQTAHG